MRTQFRKQRTQIGEINAQVEDSLFGVRVVKSFANEEIEEEKFEKGNAAFFKIKRKGFFYCNERWIKHPGSQSYGFRIVYS